MKAVVKIGDYSSNGKFQAHAVDAGDQSKSGSRYFLNYVLPGETAEIEIADNSNNASPARGQPLLTRVINPSPNRVDPFCSHYQVCGGCLLQHAGHDYQMKLKVDYLNEFWKHYLKSTEQKVQITASVKGGIKEFRNRINLHILNGKIGYYKQYTREIVEIDECPISHPAISQLIPKLSSLEPAFSGINSSLSIETDGHKVIAALKIPLEISQASLEQVMQALAKIFDNYVIFIKRKKIYSHGSDQLEMDISEFTGEEHSRLKFPSGSFSQVNPQINRLLIRKVLEIAAIIKPASIEDLYAGAGNFSIPLAKNGFKVTAVESDSELTSLGDKNSIDLGIPKNLAFYNMTVEKYLGIRGSKEVDLVIADPPRIGLKSVASKLSYAKNLILISCKVESFMDDIKNLNSFEVRDVIVFDMFPHTQHFEILSLCSRK